MLPKSCSEISIGVMIYDYLPRLPCKKKTNIMLVNVAGGWYFEARESRADTVERSRARRMSLCALIDWFPYFQWRFETIPQPHVGGEIADRG